MGAGHLVATGQGPQLDALLPEKWNRMVVNCNSTKQGKDGLGRDMACLDWKEQVKRSWSV